MGTTAFDFMNGTPPGTPEASGQQGGPPPAMGMGEERSPEAPKPPAQKDSSGQPDTGVPDHLKKACIQVIKRYVDQWAPVRRPRIRQVLKAREYLKNKQYLEFNEQNFMWEDIVEKMFSGQAGQEDLSVFHYCHNIYQAMYMGFLGSLGSDIPRLEFVPQNADRLIDLKTAEEASTVSGLIERQNKISKMVLQELGLLWTDPGYWKYTRFIIDSERAGVRQEPVMAMVPVTVSDDEYLCPECQHSTPASHMAMLNQPVCEKCGAQLSGADFYPGQQVESPQITSYKEVPNGMVAQTVYGLPHITTAPYANDILKSPILKLDEDVDIASIRASFPDFWKEIKPTNATSPDSETDKMARQYVLNAAGGRNNGVGAELLPTLSRTWIQNFAFATLDDENLAHELMQRFPKGALVVHQGELVLEIREDKLADHWRHCSAFQDSGQLGPAVGDAALDLQDELNDLRNIAMEFFDRAAVPEQIVDGRKVSTKNLNGKPRLPGGILEVMGKAANDGRPLSDAFYQPKAEIHQAIFGAIAEITPFAQLVVGIMPSVFGGGQQHIDTKGGQEQSLNTALARLNIFWNFLREEHADSGEIAVRCAAANYTEDIMDVIRGTGDKQFENKYVRLDDLRGEFHARVETEQGFPSTFGEMRDRLERLFEQATTNPYLQGLLDEPTNQRIFKQYLVPRGIKIPGQATATKVMTQIELLTQTAPTQQTITSETAQGPQQITISIPTVAPDPDCDDLAMSEKVVTDWMVENWQMAKTNFNGYENVRAYLRMVKQMGMQKAQEDAAKAALEQPASDGGGPPQ